MKNKTGAMKMPVTTTTEEEEEEEANCQTAAAAVAAATATTTATTAAPLRRRRRPEGWSMPGRTPQALSETGFNLRWKRYPREREREFSSAQKISLTSGKSTELRVCRH